MATQQEAQENAQNAEEYDENLQSEQEVNLEEHENAEELREQTHENKLSQGNRVNDKGPFIHGLSVGLGIGCIATFIIVWISIFFTPQLPSAVTYENLLSIFIYPLIYLLAVGLIALTAGIVREYFAVKEKF